MSYERALRQ